jgi:hypothetical protein
MLEPASRLNQDAVIRKGCALVVDGTARVALSFIMSRCNFLMLV